MGENQATTGCNWTRFPASLLPRPPVSLDSILGDVRSLQRGLELTQREFVRQDDCAVLKEFLRANSPTMDKLLADSKTAQVAWGWPDAGDGEGGMGVSRATWVGSSSQGLDGSGHLGGWSRSEGPPARRSREDVAGVLMGGSEPC